MKKLLFACALTATVSASAAMKVGVVDMMVLMKNHPSYESNKALLTSTEKDYQKKLDAMKEDLEKVQEEGKKLTEQVRNPMLAATAKQKIEKDLVEIQNKFLAGQQRMRNEAMRSQQDLQDLEGRLLKTTGDDLRKRIAKHAQEKGYDFVMDAAAALYSKPAYDITPDILRSMGIDPETVKAKPADEGK